jgi:hypothetical protein
MCICGTKDAVVGDVNDAGVGGTRYAAVDGLRILDRTETCEGGRTSSSRFSLFVLVFIFPSWLITAPGYNLSSSTTFVFVLIASFIAW